MLLGPEFGTTGSTSTVPIGTRQIIVSKDQALMQGPLLRSWFQPRLVQGRLRRKHNSRQCIPVLNPEDSSGQFLKKEKHKMCAFQAPPSIARRMIQCSTFTGSAKRIVSQLGVGLQHHCNIRPETTL